MPYVCHVKFFFNRIRYLNFTKVTQILPYNGHIMVQFMTFMESCNIMAMQVINCNNLWPLCDYVFHPIVFMVHCMAFMFLYININDSVWVQIFPWRSTNANFLVQLLFWQRRAYQRMFDNLSLHTAANFRVTPSAFSIFGSFLLTLPHSRSSKYESTPRRSELVSDWLKFPRAWVETIHCLLFRISIMVRGS